MTITCQHQEAIVSLQESIVKVRDFFSMDDVINFSRSSELVLLLMMMKNPEIIKKFEGDSSKKLFQIYSEELEIILGVFGTHKLLKSKKKLKPIDFLNKMPDESAEHFKEAMENSKISKIIEGCDLSDAKTSLILSFMVGFIRSSLSHSNKEYSRYLH